MIRFTVFGLWFFLGSFVEWNLQLLIFGIFGLLGGLIKYFAEIIKLNRHHANY